MSSHTKDPNEKQSTSSESSESRSDSDMDEAEENMDQLKLEEQQSKATKKVSSEPETSKNASQEGPSTNEYEPMAGPSGLQKPHLDNPDEIADPEAKNIGFTASIKEKDIERENIDVRNNVETEDIEEKTGTEQESPISEEKVESKGMYKNLEERDCASKLPRLRPPIEATSSSDSDKIKPPKIPERRRPPDDANKPRPPQCNILEQSIPKECPKSAVSKRDIFANESENTSLDVSEIQSEIADNSDSKEYIPKEQYPSIKTALERTFSEASEANISEIDEDPSVIPSHSGSAPSWSPISSSEVERRLRREEDEFKISTRHRVRETTWPVLGLSWNKSELVPEQPLGEEDKNRVSILPEQRSEEETRDSTSEKMQTTPEKGCGEAKAISGPSASKQNIDKLCETKAVRERGKDIEASGFERRVRKSKRESQLGNSPTSDEDMGSSPLKASATCRPNKKSRCDEVLLPTRRTRDDDEDGIIRKYGYGNPQQDQSTSTSDSNDCSDSEK